MIPPKAEYPPYDIFCYNYTCFPIVRQSAVSTKTDFVFCAFHQGNQRHQSFREYNIRTLPEEEALRLEAVHLLR